jgi:hypothetical protein
LLPVLIVSCTLSVFPLGAQETGNNAAAQSAPRLAGIVDLGSLSLLWDDPTATPEPLDITATANGPALLFSDRVLSLGVDLEMTTRTVQDLTALPRLPRGVVPSRILLNPLSEPTVYDAQSGSLHLLHRDGNDPERFETGFPQALEAESMRRGGLVLSDGKILTLFTRRADQLSSREITLPVAFTTGLSIDQENHLWVYDLAARQVRVFDQDGKELLAVTPDISGGTLLFPQVFRARQDGSFFLGSAGELWCFNADGSVRWQLSQFSAGFRQALPAFYRLAVGRDGNSSRSFYILDPFGNRILKFVEDDPAEGTLAATFRSFQAGQSGTNEILRLCLEEELLLQAAYFRRNNIDEPVVTDLAQRIRVKQAGLLAQLAEELKNELRYVEAEAALNNSLSIYRELRNLDPVDPRYPEAIRDITGRRNALREIRVAESRLTARIIEEGLAASGGERGLAITLTNISGGALEQVEVLVRFSSYTASSWQATPGTIRPGGEVLLTIALGAGGVPSNTEDLFLPCNLLVRYTHNRGEATEYFHLPVMVPAGTLRLPATPY